MAGVQVVIQQPVQGGPAPGVIVAGAGLLVRVGAQQVVADEPAVCVFGQQVGAGELGYRAAGLVVGQASQAGSGRDADVGAWVQAQQAEQPRGGVAQILVGPGKRGANAAGRIASVQHVQPAGCVAEFSDQAGERAGRAGVGPGHCDAHRERQPCAQCDQLADRLWLLRSPGAVEPPGHQLVSVPVAEQIQRQHMRALRPSQTRELLTAGDQHKRPRPGWQQRADLGSVPRIVQHDKQALAGERATVHRFPGLGIGRDPVIRHSQRAQEPPGHIRRRRRRPRRVEAAQIRMQLPIRKPVSDLMRPVHGQGSLADSARYPRTCAVGVLRQL